jgi:GT2 family glycosyltransferase
LSKQTLLPSQVIIIEQNPHQDSSSELDYLKHNSWPFNVVHEFTNQTGACKARNLALSKVKASYGFFADDDIRIGKNVLKEAIDRMVLYKWQVATLSCLQKDEEELSKQDKQWSSFGSGCSFFETKALQGVQFDLALEHGFGEDIDFGMQIRNKGIDVVYFPNINIIHLKAPIGGFRTKFEFPWDKETTPPKPSPTIMYNRKKNTTKQQVLGYKTVLFFKYYKVQKIKNPLRYLNHFKKQWDKSVYWANKL